MKQSKILKLLAILPLFAALTACETFFVEEECFEFCDGFDENFTIQAAIDFAEPGDTIFIENGTYSPSTNGEVFPIFLKNGVNVKGEDPERTILDAEGSDQVFNLFNYDGVVSNLTLTNGDDDLGGGIYAENSSAIFRNLIVTGNRASEAGSGIYLKNSDGMIMNNLIISGNASSGETGNDGPAQVEIDDSTITFNNNVVAFGDSDGLRLNFGADGEFENNIFYENGFAGEGAGFADTDDMTAANILYNICFGNSASDFFLNGSDLTAQQANDLSGSDQIANNFSADPLFFDPTDGDFFLQAGSPAINAGDPDPAFDDDDGSRNDIGAYGGPFAQ